MGAGELPKVREGLGKGSLAAHHQTQHVVAKGEPGKEEDGEGGVNEPRIYRMAFPVKVGARP